MGLCTVCGSEYPDGGQSKSIHESGKRHQRAYERYSQAADLTKKSVFVALHFKPNDQNNLFTIDNDIIADAFRTFGHVSRATCGHLFDHAFVEFVSEDAVQKALAAKTIKIEDSLTCVIYERRVTSREEFDGPAIDVDEVLQHVNDSCCRGFSEQIDRIVSCIAITQTEISRREVFRESFETLLRQYIQNPSVVQFGSAITGVGTNDSDVDLCLLFKSDDSSPMNEFKRDENELMSCEVKRFREIPLHSKELESLSVRDRTDLLFRILKEIRKEISGYFKSMYVVSDARCPIIRFWSYNKHLVELSVSNYIGYKKSSYIGAVVHADQSGLLRKLVLALRFWAMSNGVFTSEKKKTWNLNSYTLTLMFFTFLQNERLIPVFSHSILEEYVSDIRVDFDVPRYTLQDIDLRRLFRSFFVFCVDNPLEKLVFSMRHGGLLPLDQIQEEWNSKPQSVLFVQDPIVLTDNVAKNVTSKALRTMRHAMMLSLAAMKQHADSFAVMLRVLHTNETSTSPLPSFPPTDGSCRISGFPRNFDECMAENVLSIILFSVLRCENLPSVAKRARYDCESADLGSFVVYKKLWMSRRTLRKKWIGILAKDELFPLLVESLVSAYLDVTRQSDCCLKFQTFFELYNDSVWVGFKLIEGGAVDIGNVAHFTEQLLTKLRDFFTSNSTSVTIPTLEDYTRLVSEIFERDRIHLK